MVLCYIFIAASVRFFCFLRRLYILFRACSFCPFVFFSRSVFSRCNVAIYVFSFVSFVPFVSFVYSVNNAYSVYSVDFVIFLVCRAGRDVFRLLCMLCMMCMLCVVCPAVFSRCLFLLRFIKALYTLRLGGLLTFTPLLYHKLP